VSLYEGVALKLRKAFACFVRLGHPHAEHGRSVGLPESGDEGGVVPEMMFKRRPLRNLY
jgi:hypothetical protein